MNIPEWNNLRQAICWLLNGRKEMECLFTVLEDEKAICRNCKHNEWMQQDEAPVLAAKEGE